MIRRFAPLAFLLFTTSALGDGPRSPNVVRGATSAVASDGTVAGGGLTAASPNPMTVAGNASASTDCQVKLNSSTTLSPTSTKDVCIQSGGVTVAWIDGNGDFYPRATVGLKYGASAASLLTQSNVANGSTAVGTYHCQANTLSVAGAHLDEWHSDACAGAFEGAIDVGGSWISAANQLTAVASGTGITTNFNGIGRRGTFQITITFAAWSAAALTQDINLGTIPAKARIAAIYTDTTALFTGPAGTLTLSVGTTTGGTQLLLGHDVKTCTLGTTCVKGTADADLGASITRAAAIQGGFLPSWTGATTISARLVSSSGNLSTMTTGSTTYYIDVDLH